MIETINSVIASDVRNAYLKYLEKFSREELRTVSVNHFGVFSQDFINSIATSVEELMVSFGDEKKVIKRVFSILIEGLQNVRLHGENDDFGRQLAFLFLSKNETSYKIVFGNIILKSDQAKLSSYLDHINGLEKEPLKEMYCKILSEGYLSKKGGAGLGFLTLRLKSENELKYYIETLDDSKSLFTVEVLIKR